MARSCQRSERQVMALMNLYRAAWLRIRIAYRELALSQIHLCADDVPEIVLTLRDLRAQLDNLKGQK